MCSTSCHGAPIMPNWGKILLRPWNSFHWWLYTNAELRFLQRITLKGKLGCWRGATRTASAFPVCTSRPYMAWKIAPEQSFFLHFFQCKSSFEPFYLQVHRFKFCGHQRWGIKVNLQIIWIVAHAEGVWLLNLIRGVVCCRQKLLIHKEGFIWRHL